MLFVVPPPLLTQGEQTMMFRFLSLKTISLVLLLLYLLKCCKAMDFFNFHLFDYTVFFKYVLSFWTLLFTATYLLYHYLTKNHNYWKERGVPFEKPFFLAGNLWDVFKGHRQIGKHLGYLYTKHKSPYFGIYIMGKPYLVLRSPEIIKSVTIRDFNNFDDRTFACDRNADRMSGNSLFILRNPDWRNIRNKLTPIFTSGKLKLMFGIMKKCAKEMQIYLNDFDGQIMEIKEISAQYMTDLVASCFFGFEINSFKEKGENGFRKASREMFETNISNAISLFCYFFVPHFVSWFKMSMLDTTFLQNVFSRTVAEREKTQLKRNDFVDLLLQVKESFNENNNETMFDDDRVVSQAITFFIAGFETTSNAVAFCLYELCLRQDCQDKLRQEINKVIRTEEDITFDNIHKMEYLDMVLSETLRRYPFGPFLNRKCRENYIIKETGFVIEKDTPVLIPIDGIHHDPEYYPEPDKFDPGRFEDGNKQKLTQACVYLPFGSGPRNCIGDRFGLICAKVGLVYFLKDFKVEKCDRTPTPLILNPKSPFMTPLEGLQMMVTKIKD